MRKLLKYDMKSVFKVWWIASLAAVGVTVLGALCLRVLLGMTELNTTDSPLTTLMTISCVLGIVAAFFALAGYELVVVFFLMRRYYCHFFTDEGYLTFTLPVRRTALLASKVLMALTYSLLSMTVVLLCIGMYVVAIAHFAPQEIAEFGSVLGEMLNELNHLCKGFLPVYVLEFGLYLLASSLLGSLFAFLCITIGAIVAKRQKILAAIGIYYGGYVVVTSLSQIVFSVLINVNVPFFMNFTGSSREFLALALMGLFFVLVMAGLATLCWWLILRLLKRRLNLA